MNLKKHQTLPFISSININFKTAFCDGYTFTNSTSVQQKSVQMIRVQPGEVLE
jgi:hypothetical protein